MKQMLELVTRVRNTFITCRIHSTMSRYHAPIPLQNQAISCWREFRRYVEIWPDNTLSQASYLALYKSTQQWAFGLSGKIIPLKLFMLPYLVFSNMNMPIEMHIKKQGYAFLFSQAIKIHENNMSNLGPGIMLTLQLLIRTFLFCRIIAMITTCRD